MNGRVHSESEDSDEELPTECLPKECDDVGVTVDDLLFTACARGALAQVQALLADGACPARVDGLGRSARDVALFFGHRDCADAIMVSQLMAIFPEHHPRQLVAVAGRSSSVEEASERLLCADEEPLAASDGAGSSSDPPFSHRDHDHGPRTAATEALLASLHEILPSYDERLLADAALRCSSVEEATTWILDGMLDRGHSSAHGSASPHSALAAPPCPGSVVRLPSSEVRRLEERRNEIEEQKRRSRAEASQRALLEKEEAEQALEAELRTRVVLEELRAGRAHAVEPLLALQPSGYVLGKPERDEAGEVLHKLAGSPRSPDAGKCARVLLELGANRTLRDASGRTAFEKALSAGHVEFADAITEHVESSKAALRRRLRRVLLVAFRFHEVLQEVALRPGYSGFKRCRDDFESCAALMH